MATNAVTQKAKLHIARQMIESVSEVANTAYYVFAADHIPRTTSAVPDLTFDHHTLQVDPYRGMQFGKRVAANDVSLVIRYVPYESNVVYTMYDDEDEDLADSDYFVVVNASSFFHVFKCLDNNRGANSTVEPNFAHIQGSNTFLYQTSDGYRWKYMYTVSASVKDKFNTEDWFPFVANADVSGNAVAGSIDIIKVDGTGGGYDNYLSGTFQSTQIRVGGIPTIYEISNSSIHQNNGYYTGCLLYLSTGTGAGDYARVTNFYSNSTGNYVVIDEAFTTTPTNGTTWQLNPEVRVTGFGQTVNVVARALVNASASNSIYRVEVLERGQGYRYATANVIANSVVDVPLPAEVRPIISPYGGHGFDAASELGCSGIMFSTKFNNTESNTITSTNFFQQVGILKDPKFANVQVNISSSNGSFITNETVYKLNAIRVGTNATINTTSTTLTLASADFENQFAANDYIYLKASNGTSHMLTRVVDVTNSSTITLAANGYWACTETMVYVANVTSNAIFVSQPNTSLINFANVMGVFQSNDTFIGYSSGGFGIVNNVSRGGVTKTFDTFNQMTKLVGTSSSGTFSNNEYVYQGSSFTTANATARLHTANIVGGVLTLYVTEQTGTFTTGTVIGANTLAVASITTVYEPDIIPESGEIIYLENISPVTRQNNQTETVRINFTF